MGLVLLIVLIVLLFFVVKFLRGNYVFKYDFFTIYTGQGGSGKTTLLCHSAKITLRRRYLRNIVRRFINIFLFKKFKLQYENYIVYSDFPCYFGRRFGWARIINKSVLDWSYQIEEGCIILLDELSYLFPSKKEIPSPRERFCLVFLRHIMGKSCVVFGATQSLSRCNVALRSVVGHVYNLSNCTKGWFFSRVNVMDVIISEDVRTIYNDTSKDFKDNVYRFRFPKGTFASDYGKYFKYLKNQHLDVMDSYDYIFNLFGLKCGAYWNDFYIRPYKA